MLTQSNQALYSMPGIGFLIYQNVIYFVTVSKSCWQIMGFFRKSLLYRQLVCYLKRPSANNNIFLMENGVFFSWILKKAIFVLIKKRRRVLNKQRMEWNWLANLNWPYSTIGHFYIRTMRAFVGQLLKGPKYATQCKMESHVSRIHWVNASQHTSLLETWYSPLLLHFRTVYCMYIFGHSNLLAMKVVLFERFG